MSHKCIGCEVEFVPKRKKQKYCSVRCSKLGVRNPAWKGDCVSRKSLHVWVEEQIGRPKNCSKCGMEKKVDLANKSNLYLRDLGDWEWLCRKCHMCSDGRLEVFLSHSLSKKLKEIKCPHCLKMFAPRLQRSKHCSHSCANYSRARKSIGEKLLLNLR